MKLSNLSRVSLLLLIVGGAFAGSCPAGPPLQDDERPPVVVSSGSVDFDPTDGTFHGSGKKWKNKGYVNHNAPTVRFELEVTEGTCTTGGMLGATEFVVYATYNTNTDNFLVYIDSGELRITAAKNNMKQAAMNKNVKLDNYKPSLLFVSKGTSAGTSCTLNEKSKIKVNQKKQ